METPLAAARATNACLDRISIELTNRCAKACPFCYNHSLPGGMTRWAPEQLVGFCSDCAAHGVRAVSFGGGEPLEYVPIFEVLARLRGLMFRSLTTNGLPLNDLALMDKLVASAPEKVHVSIHFPERAAEVGRVIRQVCELAARGVRSGVNLLVARSNLGAAAAVAESLRAAGLGNDRIVYLPMRGRDTPSPDDMARVAGQERFQSMTCLLQCGRSPRFASVAWDRTVAWCSYTSTRRPLSDLTYRGLEAALEGMGLTFCGGADGA
jgi:MoaA/NifB/PqqE/SkfB family radical SAM enzyme